MRWGWIPTNPAASASPPKLRKQEINPPAIGDARALLAAADEHDPSFGALLWVLAATGARRGEVCGLRWSDIDRASRALSIKRSVASVAGGTTVKDTKTHAARRIAIDEAASTDEAIQGRTTACDAARAVIERHAVRGDLGLWVRSPALGEDEVMVRPATKAELVAAAHSEFERLWAAVDEVRVDDRDRGGVCEAWSVKDLLAHLHAWHEMTLSWEQAGSAGETPPIPAQGYSFAETPALNLTIYERTRNDDWDDIVARLRATHADLLKVIEHYSDDDLFTKQRYAWTRSTSVGAYLVSATSSHYAWAAKLIRKWAKAR